MLRNIWQHDDWPGFAWDAARLLVPLGRARTAQGRLDAFARHVGLPQRAEVLTQEAVTTSAIEGEVLAPESVRSSVARRLGLETAGMPIASRDADGVVEMLLDATTQAAQPLTAQRLFGWHAALFPTGYSGIRKIDVGVWRSSAEPMRVVSGRLGHERVHFEAPPSAAVANEMRRFFDWWTSPSAELDGLLRAGLAHLWFVTIHPFDDGNGRIARALTDMALAQDDGRGMRLYSMSAQIHAERNDYYTALERSQRGSLDVMAWLVWFLGCLERAMLRAQVQVDHTLRKGQFWQWHAVLHVNERQRKVLNRLLDAGPDGFEGGMTNAKYRSIAHTTRESAKRDIADLVAKGLLRRRPGGGRRANYEVVWPVSEE